ncbi:MAG: DUF2142 domain-containing protein [Bacilli bacterium]
MKKYINKKNIILILLFFVSFILLLCSVLFHFSVPSEVPYNDSDAVEFSVEENTIITQYYKSNVDNLESIKLHYNKIDVENNKVFISIYDYNDNLIYYNDINNGQKFDGMYLNLKFDKVKNSLNKKFKLKINIENINNDELILYRLNKKVDNISLNINNREETGLITFTEYGYSVTSFYKLVFLSLMVIIVFIFIRINFFNNKNFKNKLLKNNLLFIMETITTICTYISLISILYSSRYYGSIPILSFLILCLFGFVLISIFALFLGEKSLKPEQIFLLIGIPIGLIYLILIPLLNAPDELYHYKISYALATGQTFHNEILIPKIVNNSFNYRNVHDFLFNATNEFIMEKRGMYNPLLYLFSATGILLGNIFKLSPIIGGYFGSFCNLLLFYIIGYYIIKKIPLGKIVMIVYLLNPMFLQQAASFSADAAINIFSMLFISYVLYLKFEKENIDHKDFSILSVSYLFVLIGKYAYFPLIILLLFIKDKLINYIKNNKKTVVLFIILILAIFGGWFIYNKVNSSSEIINNTINSIPVNEETKLHFLINNPFNYIKILFNTITVKSEFYLFSFLGYRLGALNVTINTLYIVIYFIILLLSIFLEKNKYELSKTNKIITIVVFAIIFNIILLGLYLGWGIITDTIIEGVQGRYFIPINILLLLIFASKKNNIKMNNPYMLVSLSLLLCHLLISTNIINFFI